MPAAVASVHGILRHTAAAGARDLLLIEAQDEIVAPISKVQTRPF